MNHQTTITEDTHRVGYGPSGHGSWTVRCSCGWIITATHGGRNGAESEAWSHRSRAIEQERTNQR